MARNDNSVTIIGNLTDAPELRFTSSGTAMARMRLACNRRWRDNQSNEWREETDFIPVTAWRELAENSASSLVKGSRVIVTGRLSQRSWETPQGERRSMVEVQADEIGPSLRWATAQVAKVRREDNNFGGMPDMAPASVPTVAPAGGYGGGPSAPAPVNSGFSGGADEQPWDDEPAF